MTEKPTILLIGTADTKADEILFMKQCISNAGATAVIMDVGILAKPVFTPEYANDEVAAAAGTTIADIIAVGEESPAMAKMSQCASALAFQLFEQGEIHGMIALGGTMGTDLALDVANALPLGFPKFIVSTIAYSHLLPPERLAPDVMMILWSGGLYGLNSICKSALSQASGAVVGACRAVQPPQRDRPLIAMTSLGKSCLNYMVSLQPEIEARGFELAVFHTTGMGGRAFEALCAQKRFAAVMDFSLQEVANQINGSVVSSGDDRMENAGRAGIPQIVAPGAIDLVDVQAWREVPEPFKNLAYHEHNRLIGSVVMTPQMRRHAARMTAQKLARAKGPTKFILPLKGVEEWDREGEPLNDPEGLAAFIDEMRQAIDPATEMIEIDAHINDPLFAQTALAILDRWIADGVVKP